MTAALQVLDPGIQSLVEDLGRPGNAAIGVSRSGALDRGALRLANRLVGNPQDAAGLEVLAGGLVVRFTEPSWCAVAGALGELELKEHGSAGTDPAQSTGQAATAIPVESYAAVLVPAGSVLRFGRPEFGLRYYLAVRGGLDTVPVLGSRSADLLSGIGGQQLSAGDVLPIGVEPDDAIPALDTLTVVPPASAAVTVLVHPGPRSDWFTAAGRRRFFDTEWIVSSEANRIGIRLEPSAPAAPAGSAGSARTIEASRATESSGPAAISHRGEPAPFLESAAAGEEAMPLLERAVLGELPSEAMVPGAIQVSSSGLPTVLLADHPATGGYPVIAVVTDACLDVFAQLRPGQRILFRHAPPCDRRPAPPVCPSATPACPSATPACPSATPA